MAYSWKSREVTKKKNHQEISIGGLQNALIPEINQFTGYLFVLNQIPDTILRMIRINAFHEDCDVNLFPVVPFPSMKACI